MKNKLLGFLMFALLLIAIPSALAQNDDNNSENECEVDDDCNEDEYCTTYFKCEDKENENETENEEIDPDEISDETKVMINNLGANIRLMMLEKSVTWAIMRGEVVVEYFEDNLKETTRMQEILERLSAIVSASRDMRESENKNVDKYVELRVESVQLINEFKKITWNNTNSKERDEIKQLLSELNDSKIKELSDEIKEYIKEYNAEKVKKIMEKLGERRAEIEQRIRAGNMTAAEARERIREEYSKLSEEERKKAKLKLEEVIKQAKEIREKTLEQLRTETESKIRERIENRLRTRVRQR